MLKSSIYYYSDAYILVSGTITVIRAGIGGETKQLDEINKGIIFTSYHPFTDCISEINNIQIENAKDVDVMPMNNLIEYSNNYSKTSGSLWQYYRDDPNDNIVNSESLRFKVNITDKTSDAVNILKNFLENS